MTTMIERTGADGASGREGRDGREGVYVCVCWCAFVGFPNEQRIFELFAMTCLSSER